MWSPLVWSVLFLTFEISLYPISCFSFRELPSFLLGENGNDSGNHWDVGDSNEPKDFVHEKIYSAFEDYNEELEHYNHLSALIAWNISVNFSSEILGDNQRFTIQKNIWNNHWCGELLKVYHDPEFGHFQYPWDMSHLRQLYLICRGPRFSSYQLSNVLSVLGTMQQLYNKKVCIPSTGQCMRMEPDLNHFMERTRDEGQLREAWTVWHESIGTEMKPLYASLIRMLNQGARQSGFKDMGECWREETEIADLKELATKLYSDVKYLYTLLHSYVRHKLERYYGIRFHKGLIPAHLLGNMWAQKWDSLIDIMWKDDLNVAEDGNDKKYDNGNRKSSGSSFSTNMSSSPSFTLVNKLLKGNGKNATVIEMVKAAENFFVSMGLPKLPESFWRNSYFQEDGSKDGDVVGSSAMGNKNRVRDERKVNSRNCHGSSANMFGGDYRMMMCAQVTDEDLITIHHEMGHIMYFMAYSKQPTIFQEGANSAFHESVGDSITYDLLHSRGKQDEKMKSLLQTGLYKLPQIGFGLIMDLWRWELFENPDRVTEWNDLWWELNENVLGITKPHPDYNPKGEALDAAGKFHIIDNIPYIRYFLASFLQLQVYEAMCKVTDLSMGRTDFWDENLHRCQIRGSKSAGKLLWSMMEKGASHHWSEILEEMTGSKQIESRALLNYFEPLRLWLEDEIRRLDIKIGW